MNLMHDLAEEIERQIKARLIIIENYGSAINMNLLMWNHCSRRKCGYLRLHVNQGVFACWSAHSLFQTDV